MKEHPTLLNLFPEIWRQVHLTEAPNDFVHTAGKLTLASLYPQLNTMVVAVASIRNLLKKQRASAQKQREHL